MLHWLQWLLRNITRAPWLGTCQQDGSLSCKTDEFEAQTCRRCLIDMAMVRLNVCLCVCNGVPLLCILWLEAQLRVVRHIVASDVEQ